MRRIAKFREETLWGRVAALRLDIGRLRPVSDLPPPDTKRWVARRKAAILAALRSGAITIEEACRRYALSEEELAAWQRAFEADGIPGLRATRLRPTRLRATRLRSRRSRPSTGGKPSG
jgi:transposase-like protein